VSVERVSVERAGASQALEDIIVNLNNMQTSGQYMMRLKRDILKDAEQVGQISDVDWDLPMLIDIDKSAPACCPATAAHGSTRARVVPWANTIRVRVKIMGLITIRTN
jgi:hypothetical protein